MFRISRDTPAYYLTSVVKDRLPVFRTTALADLGCSAIDEARRSAGFLLFAYVLMPDHLHAIVGSELKSSKVLQYINGILSRRVIDYLKTNNHEVSLNKLRHQDRGRDYRYSLWDHHPNAKLLTTEELFMQKVNKVIRATNGKAEPYRKGCGRAAAARPCRINSTALPLPLLVDIDKINWRKN